MPFWYYWICDLVVVHMHTHACSYVYPDIEINNLC